MEDDASIDLEWRDQSSRPLPTVWQRLTRLSSVGLLVAFTVAMLILYTIAPILYRMASSTYYNLSILSSDFYGLLFGLFLYVSRSCSGDLRMAPMHIILLGSITSHISSTLFLSR